MPTILNQESKGIEWNIEEVGHDGYLKRVVNRKIT